MLGTGIHIPSNSMFVVYESRDVFPRSVDSTFNVVLGKEESVVSNSIVLEDSER